MHSVSGIAICNIAVVLKTWLQMCQDELEKLNSIVWPAIRQLAQREIANAASNGNRSLIS